MFDRFILKLLYSIAGRYPENQDLVFATGALLVLVLAFVVLLSL
jgi:type II secretory pathway component PulM